MPRHTRQAVGRAGILSDPCYPATGPNNPSEPLLRKRFSLLVFGLFALRVSALDPNAARAEYERLQKWQFSPAVPLPASQESFTRKLPARPKNVLFAPESSLLANIKRN